MKHPARDPRAWLPALAGLAMLLPRALPAPPAAPAARPVAVVMPTLHAPAPTTSARRFELVPAQSAARFLVAGPGDDGLVRCDGCTAWLDLGPGGAGALDLAIELATATTASGAGGVDLLDVLGAHRAARLRFRGELVAATTTDLPGVRELTFAGRLYFADRVVQQSLRLWLCELPGRGPRLQGHGTVPAAPFDLPVRRWCGIVARHREVTLGLDLAFRRRRDR